MSPFLPIRTWPAADWARQELDHAADYIAQQFNAAGLQPGGDDESYFQAWQQPVDVLDTSVALKNVVAILPGNDPRYAEQSLVVGAHYDHLGHGEHSGRGEDRGKIHPGADDNASGIAVMLEMARSLKGKPLPRTVVFVAFTGEETGLLGLATMSVIQRPTRRTNHCDAEPGYGWKTGGTTSDPVRHRHAPKNGCIFSVAPATSPVCLLKPWLMISVPATRPLLSRPDIPAVQFFSGHHEDFHRPGDTPDKLDYEGHDPWSQRY